MPTIRQTTTREPSSRVVSHCSALSGWWGERRLIISKAQRVIRLAGRVRNIMGHPWLRLVKRRLTAVCDSKMYPYLLPMVS
ncbi:hypothetical protein JD549_00620 [Aeromonas dhakensis]|nr:hypothetical protein [Aeromonas dhakensis]MBL0657342.1 hypothetical protein [Aeromonas dhakensis]